LGNLTAEKLDADKVVGTLNFAVDKLLNAGYLPFNLSFHGGEVTTLPTSILDKLLAVAKNHYATYAEEIKALGFRVNPLHIKTNLLNFQKHYEVLSNYQVSISGSVDLPLKLHEVYRRDKQDNSTLSRIVANLQLLSGYPHHKKISCVITQAHLKAVDDLIADIKFLHHDVGLDMSRFKVMFGFDSKLNNDKFAQQLPGTEMLNHAEQVEFYRKIKQAFTNTSLEYAFKTEWFKEFTPDFCCSAVNCGDKFFLLQANGEVYSCPRGQSSTHYRYGNIYHHDIEQIIANGWKVMERNENRLEFDNECLQCEYIHYCNLGCTFVRQETGLTKSYTCSLQKELYQDNPDQYRPLSAEQIAEYSKQLLLRNNLNKLTKTYPNKRTYFTPELGAESNQLIELINKDTILVELYSEDLFFLRINGIHYTLKSAILKNESDLEILNSDSEVLLGIRDNAWALACNYEVNNYVHIMLLRNTTVVYGDEQRHKQEHIYDYSLYKNALITVAQPEKNYFVVDLSPMLKLHAQHYLQGVTNNLFFTTRALRDYHYLKQKNNAFYHIQAINLPFQNIEFLWQP
jgi:uncharacterized protein